MIAGDRAWVLDGVRDTLLKARSYSHGKNSCPAGMEGRALMIRRFIAGSSMPGYEKRILVRSSTYVRNTERRSNALLGRLRK